LPVNTDFLALFAKTVRNGCPGLCLQSESG